MSGHVYVLLLFLVLAFVVAVPRITRRRSVPRQLVFEEVPDSALAPVQAQHFARLDAAVRALQYGPVFNIRVANLAGQNLSRFYGCAADPAIILTSLLRVRVKGSSEAHNLDYVEIITRYQDGTMLTTSNSPVASPFDRVPQRVTQRLPGLDVRRLKERHDAAAAKLAPADPLWVRDREILDRWQESHRRWCEHQVQSGLLAYDRSSDSYGPTRRTAFRGIASYLNPLAGVTAGRVLLGLLCGALLTTAGAIAAREGLAAPVMVAAYTLAGFMVGLTFSQRHFVWALILGMAPVAAVGADTLARPVLATAWLGLVASGVARWQNRRRRLLP